MKKISIILLLLTAFLSSKACDICGCGVGSYYIGLLPEFNKRFVGLRYQYSAVTTQLDINGNRTALTSDERYRSTEIWGAWNLGNRWRIMAIVPYNFNEKYNEGTETFSKKNGLGDIVLNAYFKIFEHTATANDKLIAQSLWAGVGIKGPTGSYDLKEQTAAAGSSPNIFQLGTGSTDLLMNLRYDIRMQDFGVNANATYKFNTENADDYRYGNKLSGNLAAYYKISMGMDKRIVPNVGLSYDHQAKDETLQHRIDETGGHILNAVLGVETSFKAVSLGFTFQAPMSQNLGMGRIHAGQKGLAHVSFAF